MLNLIELIDSFVKRVKSDRNARLPTFLAIAFFAALLRLYRLDYYEIFGDEGIYAQVAKNCLLDSRYWLFPSFGPPHLFDKPPLAFWLVATSYLIFGVSEFSARLPSAIMGVGSVVLVYYLGRSLYDERVGLLSAYALAVMQYHILYARHAMLDAPVTFFILLSTALIYNGLKGSKPLLILLGGVSSGLGFLTKFWPAFLPYIFLIPYLITNFKSTSIKAKLKSSLYLLSSFLCALLIGFSWVYVTDSWQMAVGFNLLERFGQKYIFNMFSTEYLAAFLWGTEMGYWTLPATIGLFLALHRRRKEDLLVASWFLIPAALFAFSEFHGQYAMPISPAVALLTAIAIIEGVGKLSRGSRLLEVLTVFILLSWLNYFNQPCCWPTRLGLSTFFNTRGPLFYETSSLALLLEQIINVGVLAVTGTVFLAALFIFFKGSKNLRRQFAALLFCAFLAYPLFEESCGLMLLPDYYPNPFTIPSCTYNWHNLGWREIGQFMKTQGPPYCVISSYPTAVIFHSNHYYVVGWGDASIDFIQKMVREKRVVYMIVYLGVEDVKHPQATRYVMQNCIDITNLIPGFPAGSPLKVYATYLTWTVTPYFSGHAFSDFIRCMLTATLFIFES
jgi:4-amino-4-deoxy-L-arabinose transferase-like glycosyltransferase